MKKVLLLLFGLLFWPLIGCSNNACGDISTSSHNTLQLCSTDCQFEVPETYSILQEDCVVDVALAITEENSESFT